MAQGDRCTVWRSRVSKHAGIACFQGRKVGVVQNGICCSGRQVAIEKDDVGSSPPSILSTNPWRRRNKVYSYDEFIEHFRKCREAQNLWKLSNQGVDVSEISGFVKRAGDLARLSSNSEWNAGFP
ncbi:hypothetical protein N7447_010847 [Penicillium robsamsonii]|uniref:uncharacterized protein n=1 Tax=Penicillium robsamsonii TaxID=1792511 RepID=UPI0025476B81|nr:uncharacterized protein N7447_010847 [Penicillium robsamsonii]KAJ5807391.1 hypothetical protein N7447_010847 [Penicillium robsamsonii]